MHPETNNIHAIKSIHVWCNFVARWLQYNIVMTTFLTHIGGFCMVCWGGDHGNDICFILQRPR